ncbi:MAG: DUF192 domain-containing protein [Planctomycetota bacterium]
MADVNPCLKNAIQWSMQLVLTLALLPSLTACGNGGEPADTAGPEAGSDPGIVETVDVTLKGQTFSLELALDHASRIQGLSDRKSIAEDGGMLFIFPRPVQTMFQMRRCYVPIDVVFIDEDGYIDSLHAMQVIEPIGSPRWKNPASGYPTAGPILYAIELAGGKIEELGLRRGEKVELPEAVLQLEAQ